MTMSAQTTSIASSRPPGIVAVEAEMARQLADALLSYEQNRTRGAQLAASLRRTGQLLLLGMGGSHCIGRQVEHWYRAAGVDAIAIPLSEQLLSPLRTAGRTTMIASQSGESAEVVRWLRSNDRLDEVFGLTLAPDSTLGRSLPALIGNGGVEVAFAATRSLTISFALHLAVLDALGFEGAADAIEVLRAPPEVDITVAASRLAHLQAIVTSGRSLQGLAEAIALGLTELVRIPVFALEGGQLRHGPMEALGPHLGALLFRAADATAELVAGLGNAIVASGSPTLVFDASGEKPIPGTLTIAFPRLSGPAAVLAMLPTAQRLMLKVAMDRLPDAGTPQRSTKITRIE